MTAVMNQMLNKFKKSAYLSFQLIVHYKHIQLNESNTVLFSDVKNIKDLHYQPIVLTVPNNVNFNKVFQISFMHICEHFHEYSTYATPSLSSKKKKRKRLLSMMMYKLD